MSEKQDEQEHEPAGLPDADDLSEEEVAKLDQEREERLADENRPDGAETDNSERTFDPEAGMFTDNPEHSEADRPFTEGDEA